MCIVLTLVKLDPLRTVMNFLLQEWWFCLVACGHVGVLLYREQCELDAG